MGDRFGQEHIETWRREGCLLMENFFTPDEVAAVQADFRTIWPRTDGAAEALVIKKPGETGRFNEAQFKTVSPAPFDCSPALNLIGVHPALIAFARQALGVPDVYIYQFQAWAKFTGDADYDQPFHCDYVNHTLTAPSEDPQQNTVTFFCYFSDVTEAHGPAHYVTRTDGEKVAGPEATLDYSPAAQGPLQEGLRQYERSTASPAGSIFPYGIDVWHRGTNMTAPGGHRYVVTACFKAAGHDAIAYHAWPFHHMAPWRRIFDHATPEQLACFGVQRPGDPFWTETTLRRAQARYPNWDMTPYRQAAGL